MIFFRFLSLFGRLTPTVHFKEEIEKQKKKVVYKRSRSIENCTFSFAISTENILVFQQTNVHTCVFFFLFFPFKNIFFSLWLCRFYNAFVLHILMLIIIIFCYRRFYFEFLLLLLNIFCTNFRDEPWMWCLYVICVHGCILYVYFDDFSSSAKFRGCRLWTCDIRIDIHIYSIALKQRKKTRHKRVKNVQPRVKERERLWEISILCCRSKKQKKNHRWKLCENEQPNFCASSQVNEELKSREKKVALCEHSWLFKKIHLDGGHIGDRSRDREALLGMHFLTGILPRFRFFLQLALSLSVSFCIHHSFHMLCDFFFHKETQYWVRSAVAFDDSTAAAAAYDFFFMFGGYFCCWLLNNNSFCVLQRAALRLCVFFFGWFGVCVDVVVVFFRGFIFFLRARFNHVAESAIMLLVDNDNC